MSKPILLTDDLISKMQAEFVEHLRKAKLSDGKLTYTKSFSYEDENDKVSLMFTPLAYIKMLALVQHVSDEIAWHGFVERKADDLFLITDIVVYPQTVTATNVNTDQERYQRWIMEIDDDKFNNLRMQGHSHVNMSTSPSSVDLNHQEQILQQLTGDTFYIFIIWNKRGEHHIKIYDFATNTLYEDRDITVGVVSEDFDMQSFLHEVDQQVVKRSYVPAEAKSGKKQEAKPSGKGKSAASTSSHPSYYSGGYGGYGSYGYNGANTKPDYDQMMFGSRFDT